MKANRLTVTLLGLMIALAGFLFWQQFAKPPISFRPSAAVGEVLAEEVARLVGVAGTVVVIGRSPAKEGVDAKGEQLRAFEAALRRQGSPKLKTTERLPPPQPGTMDLGEVSPEQLAQFIEKNPDANAFIIFAGLPPLTPDLAGQISARSLRLLAVCGYGGNVRGWLEAKALSLAVVPRFDDPPAGTPPPKTAMDWFQREFQLLTPEKLANLGY